MISWSTLILPILLGLTALNFLTWYWLASRATSPGLKGVIASTMGQLFLLLALYQLMRGAHLWSFTVPVQVAAFLVRLGDFSLPINIEELAQFSHLFERVFSASFVAAILALGLAVAAKKLRPFWLVIPGLVFLVTAVALLERVSMEAMCKTAQARNTSTIKRNSFLWSMWNAPREFQFGLHAEARFEGETWGWSYSEMDWYREGSQWGSVENGATVDCTSVLD